MTRPPSIVGAIEAGGTRFICAVGSGPGAGILERVRFDSGDDPVRLMREVAAWLLDQQERHGDDARIYGAIALAQTAAKGALKGKSHPTPQYQTQPSIP